MDEGTDGYSFPFPSKIWEEFSSALPGFDFGDVVIADPDCTLYPKLLNSFVKDMPSKISLNQIA